MSLSRYEPEFFFPIDVWSEKSYTVQLTITPEILAKAQGGVIFYFCHIHAGMSGRIRLVNSDGSNVTAAGKEPELYSLYQPGEFDLKCGTFEAGAFAAGASPDMCPGMAFLCDEEATDFGKCMHAIDCKMMVEMRTVNQALSPTATFMHQMIPHHANAVNMAKVLLKFDDGEPDKEIENLMLGMSSRARI